MYHKHDRAIITLCNDLILLIYCYQMCDFTPTFIINSSIELKKHDNTVWLVHIMSSYVQCRAKCLDLFNDFFFPYCPPSIRIPSETGHAAEQQLLLLPKVTEANRKPVAGACFVKGCLGVFVLMTSLRRLSWCSIHWRNSEGAGEKGCCI